MSITSAASPVESTPIAPRNGASESVGAFPTAVPDDVLYEVVDGKIVEKTVGVYEVDIATFLVSFLACSFQHVGLEGSSGVDLPHRSSQGSSAAAGCRFRVSR